MKTRRVKVRLVVGLLAVVAAAIGAGDASATTLVVCPSGCAFSQVGPAVADAKNGDTISIGPGTYAGGVMVDKSVKLVGAGAGRTTISGGGPVLTIGTFGAASEPTVSIDGVKITGGKTRTSWATGLGEGVIALGGGIEIPPNGDFSGGANVTIANSVISGNELAPSATAPVGPPCPDGNPCPFAGAFGGGIDNWGSLTLANTTVSDNLIGSASGLGALASDAEGAGIRNVLGPLTITNSEISGNQAAVTAPDGRFADAGGILLVGGTLTMSNSSVADNRATVTAAFPSSVEAGVPAGGMHVADGVQEMTISNTNISGNTATMTNSVGDANASSGGLHIDANPDNVSLSNDVISNNQVNSTTLSGSTGNADGSSGAGEISGTFSNIRLTDNTVDVRSAAGNATAEGGATVFDGGTVTNSLISDNHVNVSSPHGSAVARGGGIWVAVSLTLRNSTVSENTADSSGESGSARGGGIFDIPFPDGPDGAPGGPLVLQNSKVTGNALTGSTGSPLQGAGLYIQGEPLTSTNSVIAGNTPDQCFGC